MKTVIEMAREAGFQIDGDSWIHAGVVLIDGRKAIDKQLERFAELVREAEREACAEKTGEFARKWWSIHCASNKHMETTRKAHDDFCALQAAIRSRSNT